MVYKIPGTGIDLTTRLPRGLARLQNLSQIVKATLVVERRCPAQRLPQPAVFEAEREIANLTLDDVDWKHERLHVRERKADHVAVYPLSPLVCEAIVAYLKAGRPQTEHRFLLLRCLAPHVPLTHAAVSRRASHYLRKAGVPVRQPGSHTLRHTCVQRLVDSSFPLKTIGDHVGHRSPHRPKSTAKVAVATLRDMARQF